MAPHEIASQPLALGSRLVSDFFDYMNSQNFAWVVMNNYEDLPWVIPSDIDFSVPPELFHRLDRFVEGFAQQTGSLIVQKLWHGNMKCAYILAIGSKIERAFVQLDFFTAFSTKGCPALLPHDVLVGGRRAFRNFHVPRPEVELVFTAMRRLFKDDWSKRHCDRIAELNHRITTPDWLPSRYCWMRATLEAATEGKVEKVKASRDSDWVQLKQTAKANLSFYKLIANLTLQTKRIAVRLRDETGQLIVLTGPLESIGSVALETLELVFHRHMVLDEKVLEGGMYTLLAKLAILKRRKGLIFILARPGNSRTVTLARKLDRIGLVDQVLIPKGTGKDLPGLKSPVSCFSSSTDALESIIAVQTAKAARAMMRGGTQTSASGV